MYSNVAKPIRNIQFQRITPQAVASGYVATEAMAHDSRW